VTVWDEWGALTRFLESARLASARESRLWHSLELRDRESVTITAPRGGQGQYEVKLQQHLDAVDDEVTLHASVLIHSYALAEATGCALLGIDSRKAGGIEKWGHQLLVANDRDWTDVIDGRPGAVESPWFETPLLTVGAPSRSTIRSDFTTPGPLRATPVTPSVSATKSSSGSGGGSAASCALEVPTRTSRRRRRS
jgi:hypothetical protein